MVCPNKRGFNPRPPRRTGATVSPPSSLSSSSSFNPRPPRRTGATPNEYACQCVSLVSILARPEGRALQLIRAKNATIAGFQSSPAPKDGRYPAKIADALGFIVSILARPEGRALRRITREGRLPFSFNPRPPRRTGATCGHVPMRDRFGRFNPRPPRRTGATYFWQPRPPQGVVSILARPEGRALRGGCLTSTS